MILPHDNSYYIIKSEKGKGQMKNFVSIQQQKIKPNCQDIVNTLIIPQSGVGYILTTLALSILNDECIQIIKTGFMDKQNSLCYDK